MLGLGITAGAGVAAEDTPAFVLTKAAAAPTIDGKPDDACWKSVRRYPLRHYAGGELKVGGSVALCYDGAGLSVALWLDEPAPAKMVAPKVAVNAAQIWDGEILEWFLCPSEEGNEYVQLGWNPAGSQFNARCVSTGPGTSRTDTTWRPQWHCASVTGAKGWTTEARVTFAEMGVKPPAEGARWRLNVNRTRQIGGREYSGLSPTGTAGFHLLERYQEVSFGKFVARDETVKRGATPRALIACWGHRFGLGAIFEPHVPLDQVLGKENVDLRVCASGDGGRTGSARNWPRLYRDLAAYDLVVFTDVPASCFTDVQLQDLRRYVLEGGSIVFMGQMTGWLHQPQDAWWKSPLGEFMPTKPAGPTQIRRIDAAAGHLLFAGIPLAEAGLTVRSVQAALEAGATQIAGAGDTPFIAEKAAGKGRVLQIQGLYAHASTYVPVSCFRTDLFMSAYYPVFWGNLVRYATGRAVPRPATPPPAPPRKETALVVDLINDNYGDLFRPGATLRVKPLIEGRVEYPYEIAATLEGPALGSLPAGRTPIPDDKAEVKVALPLLDRGRYTLRLELRKGPAVVDTVAAPFAVALPLLAEDEFNFKVVITPDYQGEADARRIAAELKSIGFTGICWLGGDIYANYLNHYRCWSEARLASRFQELGLRVTPVYYSNLYYVCYPGSLSKDLKPGNPHPYSKLPYPDMAYPGKEYLPHARFWLDILGDKYLGRMPLTDGYAGGDELIGLAYPETDRLRQGFEAAAGVPAPAEGKSDNAAPYLNYRLRMTSDFLWFARSVSNAYNPVWSMESTITPNTFLGHTSCVCSVPGTASAMGATSTNEFWYGEPKLYSKSLESMATLWSATDFGRRSRPEFMGGQLNNSYYEEFPEQVFAALSAGARSFSVFAYDCTSFETNGRQDPKFAEIARRTTHDASRIGRTLNHYDRSRARVALLYPHTSHLWSSMGKRFNADYLEMTGFSEQYLDLTYATEATFDFLRRMNGHVDVLFDEQVARGDLRNYDVVVLTHARQVEERTLRALRRFVEGGGTLLVTTDSGRLNENNQATETLYGILPAVVGEERAVPTDYSITRMRKAEAFSKGHALTARGKAEVLFTFEDGRPACVRGTVGRGEAVLLGMPLPSLNPRAGADAKLNASRAQALSYLWNDSASLISRPDNPECSAITFLPRRGDGRVFMVFSGNKAAVTTRVEACGDEAEARYTLADIVTGEKVPFEVKDGKLAFTLSCPDRWGRALALMPRAPARVEVSTGGAVAAGGRFLVAVRILGADGQPVPSTLPLELTVKDPDGNVRDDLGGVRVAEQGIYTFGANWPVGAKKGTWTVIASERISGASDSATWAAE